MNTTSNPTIAAVPHDGPHGVANVPSLDQLYELTAVPEQRVVFPDVDWAFYERLVDSIPESCNIHVDYDGKDLEVMGKGPKHGSRQSLLGRFIDIITEEHQIACQGLSDTTWKRPKISRGLEADDCYYFLPEKLQAYAAADQRGSDDVSDYPNPDLAIEVDISEPRVDRPGIYAALDVAEVWRFDGREVVIERLTPEKTYESVEASQFLPVRADEVRRWLVEEDSRDQSAWARRLRAEIRKKFEG
jgi:Uma2 family endonuclease